MYPTRNTSTYSAPTKNSSSSTLPEQSWQKFLLIDTTFFLLVDTVNKLLLEPNSIWSYKNKS